MKYIIKCGLTDNSIKDLKYFEHKISKKYNQIKNKNIFYVPLISFNYTDYIKFNPQLLKKLQKFQTFRINVSDIKFQNKIVYLLIKPLGFISSIQRLLEEYFITNNIKYSKLNKWDYLFIEYTTINKLNINIDDLFFPSYIKISSINIFRENSKKNTPIESINLKNI
ncbi:Hypothetical protein SFBmNL_01633 [Candidatus Arthromitus sp. SFB-mouse-NL]|uniref:hypothetical protein n=1 Tax=Candidatus Arthromitus sp. SFB-mouse-NL TaxID=1508644 RepID=UPI00049A623D|nr:hypothetical protein [Candidatus Arthromitus sp. SFB-mouse-NL]AID45525.1 Hypothetical protein SFBmNL_01633 [Candidatus Arthromitus sp. SFB-mouse-NL]